MKELIVDIRAIYQQSYLDYCLPVCKKFPAIFRRCRYEDWRWSRAMVQTRGFTIRRHPKSGASVPGGGGQGNENGMGDDAESYTEHLMAPIAELMDHSPSVKTHWVKESSNAPFRVVTDTAVHPGEEMLHSYTTLSSASAISSFGFIPGDLGDKDYVSVWPDNTKPAVDGIWNMKYELLERLGLLDELRLPSDGNVPTNFFLNRIVRGLSSLDLVDFGTNFNATVFLNSYIGFHSDMIKHLARSPPVSLVLDRISNARALALSGREINLLRAVLKERQIVQKSIEIMSDEIAGEIKEYCADNPSDVWTCSLLSKFPIERAQAKKP